MLCIVLASLVSALLATAVAYPPVNGAGFVLACGLAVLTVRPQDLLTLSVSPPLAYFCGVLLAECVLSVGVVFEVSIEYFVALILLCKSFHLFLRCLRHGSALVQSASLSKNVAVNSKGNEA